MQSGLVVGREVSEQADIERKASEGVTHMVQVFRGEVQDLRRQLDTRADEMKIVQGHLMTSEVACVQAELEYDSLAEDVTRVTQEKMEVVHLTANL